MGRKTITSHSCCVNITREGLPMARKLFSPAEGGKMKNSHILIARDVKTHVKVDKAKFLKPEKNSHSKILNKPGITAQIA